MDVKREWFEKDYYAILGVSPDANEKEIQKSYRKLARDLHPDQNPGDKKAEERFKDVSAAYDVIGDPNIRSKYDEARQMGPRGMGGFSSNFGGQPGDLSDLINSMFSSGSPFEQATHPRPQKGANQQAQLRLTFDESITGIETSVTVHAQSGTSQSAKIRIPAGVEDGQRIRLKGKGDPGPHGGPSGDLIVIIRVSPHTLFGREDTNLTVQVPVSFLQAALGADIQIPTYPNGSVKLRLPAGTQTGSTFRIKEAGIHDGDATGDLLVTIEITVPQKLDEQQEKALKDLRDLFPEGHNELTEEA
ncbi:MAG: DnaJ C-terminal domain-containing protein [Actinomycetota bacterium]|nr:DnaJ C-terminal domain-containing protein [Actinomycetota bacterium]